MPKRKLSRSWCILLNAWCSWMRSFLPFSLIFFKALLFSYLMNWSTLPFIRFEVNIAVVDRWKRKTSRWRPFWLFEESKKIAVMAVRLTPSRLVTLGSRLLKKVQFWDCSVKILVSGLESARPWSRVDSWAKTLSGTVLYRVLVSSYKSALPYRESTLKKFLFWQVLY